MGNKHPCTRINPSGFTLVEGIVGSAILVLGGMIIFIVLQINNQGVSNSTLNARIQMQYETVVEQIGRSARFANVVLLVSESWPPAANAMPVSDIKAVKLFNDQGDSIGGYRIVNATTLQEYDTTALLWKNFRVGPNDVKVTSNSGFSLTANRKWLTVNLSVFSSYASLVDTAVSKQEVFLCKN
jgi:hypothetical protein